MKARADERKKVKALEGPAAFSMPNSLRSGTGGRTASRMSHRAAGRSQNPGDFRESRRRADNFRGRLGRIHRMVLRQELTDGARAVFRMTGRDYW